MTDLTKLSAQLVRDDFTSIPIIDLSDAESSDLAKRQALAEEVRDACLNAGFFYVKNHSVPPEIVDATFEQSKAFFALPDEVKKTVDISKSSNFRGYMGLLTSNTNPNDKGDMHQAFNMGLDPLVDPSSFASPSTGKAGELKHSENLWPDMKDWEGAEQFKHANLEYYKQILALGYKLFPLFALALNLPENFFEDKTKHPAAIMRILFYPGLGDREVDELMPGIGAHTDFECFTILRQDEVSGLQVQNRKGQWIDAVPTPNTFIVNIGDQLSRWTNGIFVSTRHRVLPALARDRYSIPFFFGCDHDVPLVPPETCITQDRPARYEVMTAGAYVHMRLSEVYAPSQVKT